MTDFKRILVPVDGSETSDRAVAEAGRLAKLYDATVYVFYVANINQLAINACLSDAILEAVNKAGEEILKNVYLDVDKYRFIEISTGKEIPDLKAYREELENKEKFEMNM